MTTIRKTLVVVAGPTGSGKTDLSVSLAKHYGSPILSTDSRQIFRGIPIGTAQPDAEQLAAVRHYFIADHDVRDPYTCGAYERDALKLLEELFETHDLVIAVGGSGLYIDALCHGMDELPDTDPPLREELTSRLEKKGLEALAAELQSLDPDYYERVDRNNPQRVVRALEVCLQTGRPYSSFRSGVQTERPFRIVRIGTDLPREVLYDRINRRVDQMIDAGLEAEARAFYPLRELNALQTVGYRELFEYFDGKLTLSEAVELIKRNTRRYAKRQLTWFRREPSMAWFDPSDTETIIRHIDSVSGKTGTDRT